MKYNKNKIFFIKGELYPKNFFSKKKKTNKKSIIKK